MSSHCVSLQTRNIEWVGSFREIHLFIHSFIHPFINGIIVFCWALTAFSISQSCTPSLGLLGRGEQPIVRSLPTHTTTQTQNKRKQTFMPRVRFEHTTPECSRGRRQFMPQTARPPWPKQHKSTYSKVKRGHTDAHRQHAVLFWTVSVLMFSIWTCYPT
jgi:hypothetical protein